MSSNCKTRGGCHYSKQSVNNYLLITKSKSKFYYSKLPAAVVFNYLFNYKITNKGIGFPDVAFDKVINKLNELKINYKIEYSDGKIIYKDFKKKNNYFKILSDATFNFNIKLQFDILEKEIMNLSSEKIKSIMDIIYENISK